MRGSGEAVYDGCIIGVWCLRWRMEDPGGDERVMECRKGLGAVREGAGEEAHPVFFSAGLCQAQVSVQWRDDSQIRYRRM